MDVGSMWNLDIPSESELRLLAAINAPAVVTIYMPTTPISQDGAAEAMALHNLVKEAMIEVRQRPELPRGDDEYIEVQLLDLIDDDDFWSHRSHGLGVITNSEGEVRLIVVVADLPPKEVKVAGMPSDAASAVLRYAQ